MMIIQTVLYVFSFLVLVAVVLPLIKSDYWVFRVFEYPRFQKLLLVLITLAAATFFNFWNSVSGEITIGLLSLATVYLLYKILPYTPLNKKEMRTAKEGEKGNLVKIFTANVLQYNHHYDELKQLIRSTDPDIVFLVETGHAWDKAMEGLKEAYPHCIKKPLDNTYGMLFYSRLPVIEGTIKFLIENDVPSLHAVVEMKNNVKVQLWGLHPKPPAPQENLYSTAKDKEIMKIAFKARDTQLPVIVFGDFNDVAWSHVTELFRKVSNLLDPRRGRGFYSTFNAKNWFMRFPLDYIFASEHFSIASMKRLPPCGSDHFPILTELCYNQLNSRLQEAPDAEPGEIEDAVEILNK